MANVGQALGLAGCGVPIFPCGSDKRPLTKGENGARWGASADSDIIRARWTQCPDALIGVPCGVKFDVLDLDLQHADAQAWHDEHRRDLPLTREHATRSGGRHLLFQPHASFRNSAGKLAPHIDTRGAGGFVIWWPAEGLEVLHASALADVPDWIVAKLNPPEPAPLPITRRAIGLVSARRKLDGVIRTIATAREGERNSVTFWGGCRLAEMVREGILGRDHAISITVEAASRSGLPRAEARASALSALRTIGA
jgi:hypothetical protein